LGKRLPDGGYRAVLERTDVYELVGYVLLDLEDTYRLDEVGTFNTRYGYLSAWPLNGFLDELAGRAVNLAGAREEFGRLLTGGGGV
jgi:hypothetical protein